MIPRILHFSIPERPTDDQRRAIDEARRRNPDWEVKVWQDPVQNDGFLLKDYHCKANSGAQLADLIRLDAIFRFGGIYLDSDIFLNKSLLPLTSSDHFFCSEDGKNLTNAAFGATSNNRLIEKIIRELLENEPDWTLPPNVTTGPVLFARVLQWESELVLLPRETFYPYNWNEEPVAPLPNSYGVHAWAASWSNSGKKVKRSTKSRLREALVGKVRKAARPLYKSLEARLVKVVDDPRQSYAYGQDLIASTNRGILMSLPGSDLSITPEIALRGTYEETELRFIEKHLSGGDFFIDVGCNVGIFSLVAARRVGPFGRVYAFDPNPTVLDHLRRSLVINWLHDRTIVADKAVGDSNDPIELQFSENILGGANMGLPAESAYHRSVEQLGGREIRRTIDQVRLDEVFKAPIEIKILKIDVEGFEHKVLAGARKMLADKCFRYIILELLEEVAADLHRLNLEAANDLMQSGYAPCRIGADGSLSRCASLRESRRHSRNVLFERV